MAQVGDSVFEELFASKIGKVDAAIEAIGDMYTGHDGADFCLEANDLIGERYLCQALLNTDGTIREWSITISSTGSPDGPYSWIVRGSYSATFKSGKLNSLRGR